MAKQQNWTIIKESGRTEFKPDTDYFSVLSSIGHEFMTAGGNWDRPNMLLLNGKVVVPSGIADIGWKYVNRQRELQEELGRKIRAEFLPDWPQEGDE